MLKEIIILNYRLNLQSGMHIGGSADIFDIGGADSTVIKNPMNNQPYIPGSTMKGKIRSLLSQTQGEIVTAKYGDKPDLVIRNDAIRNLFEPLENGEGFEVSRAVFRDAKLTVDSAEKLQRFLGAGVFTEIKAENKIDPFKGKAENPRFIERVPAGVDFEGEIVLQIFDGDQKETMINALEKAFTLLENSYIGGSGTRGYGRVKLVSLEKRVVDVHENV